MAIFLDPKERSMEIILTEHGRKKLGQGKFRPVYFSFADDEVDYQTPHQSQITASVMTAFDLAMSKTFAGGNLLPEPGLATWTPTTGATVTDGVSDPAGNLSAFIIEDVDLASSQRYATSDSGVYQSGEPVVSSLFIKKEESVTFPEIRILFDGNGSDGFSIEPNMGDTIVRLGTFVSIDVVQINDWWFVEFGHAGAAASTVGLRIYGARGFSANFDTVSSAATGGTTVYGPRISYV